MHVNIEAAFSFSRHVIKTFKDNQVDPANGARGTLIFTGATASLRGNVTTSVFAAGKSGLRALSQSLSKEFGKQDIHIAHVSHLETIHSNRYFLSLLLGNHRWRFVQAYVTTVKEKKLLNRYHRHSNSKITSVSTRVGLGGQESREAKPRKYRSGIKFLSHGNSV